jgi:hypothetical protein
VSGWKSPASPARRETPAGFRGVPFAILEARTRAFHFCLRASSSCTDLGLVGPAGGEAVVNDDEERSSARSKAPPPPRAAALIWFPWNKQTNEQTNERTNEQANKQSVVVVVEVDGCARTAITADALGGEGGSAPLPWRAAAAAAAAGTAAAGTALLLPPAASAPSSSAQRSAGSTKNSTVCVAAAAAFVFDPTRATGVCCLSHHPHHPILSFVRAAGARRTVP